MFGAAKSQQCCAQQWSGSEIERLACVMRAQPLYFLHTFTFRDVTEIQERQRQRETLGNDLHRFVIDLSESGAQRFMALYDFVEAALQSRDIQIPCEIDGRSHVVSSVIRLQPLQEPQPLLRERKRNNKDFFLHAEYIWS